MGLREIEEKILPISLSIWEVEGVLVPMLEIFEQIDEIQTISLTTEHPESSINELIPLVDQALKHIIDVNRRIETRRLQKELGITPSIGEDIHIFEGANMLVPAATFGPGPLDVICVAHDPLQGVVIGFQESLRGHRVAPAIEQIISRKLNINLVDALVGPRQIPIGDWFHPEEFDKSLLDFISKTANMFLEFTGGNRISTSRFSLSGLEYLIEEDLSILGGKISDTIVSVLDGYPDIIDMSRLGKDMGWIYGGDKDNMFSYPTPFGFSESGLVK